MATEQIELDILRAQYIFKETNLYGHDESHLVREFVNVPDTTDCSRITIKVSRAVNSNCEIHHIINTETGDRVAFETDWLPLTPSMFSSSSRFDDYSREEVTVIKLTQQDHPSKFVSEKVHKELTDLLHQVKDRLDNNNNNNNSKTTKEEEEEEEENIDYCCCFTKKVIVPTPTPVTSIDLKYMWDILIPCEIVKQSKYANILIDTKPSSMEAFVESITDQRRYKLTLCLGNLITIQLKTGVLIGKVFIYCVKIQTR